MKNKIEYTRKLNWTGEVSICIDANEKHFAIMELAEFSTEKPHPLYGNRNKFLTLVLNMEDIKWMKESIEKIEKEMELRNKNE